MALVWDTANHHSNGQGLLANGHTSFQLPESSSTSHQVRLFTFKEYKTSILSALRLIVVVILRRLRLDKWHQRTIRVRRWLEDPAERAPHFTQAHLSHTGPGWLSGSHAIGTLSRLFAATSLWVPWFILDVQVGREPSRKFVNMSYGVVVFGAAVGLVIVSVLFSNVIESIVPKMAGNVTFIMSGLIMMSEISYATLGLLGMGWMLYIRSQIHHFLIHTCTRIVVPKVYQEDTTVWLFLTSVILCLLAEPLFGVLTMLAQFNQDRMLSMLSKRNFEIIKHLLTGCVFMGSMCLSLLERIVPVMTCLISCLVSKHLELAIENQLSRIYPAQVAASATATAITGRTGPVDIVTSTTSGSSASSYKNSIIEQRHLSGSTPVGNRLFLEHDYERQLIVDYSLDTLISDWPCNDSRFLMSHEGREKKENNHDDNDDDDNHDDYYDDDNLRCDSGPMTGQLGLAQEGLDPAAAQDLLGGRVLVYKNVLKILRDLVGIIQTYERMFRGFHALQLGLSSVLIVQWIVIAMVNANVIGQIHAPNTANTTAAVGSKVVSQFAFRTLLSAVICIVDVIILFNRFERLPRQMCKLRSKLFKINLRFNHLLPMYEHKAIDELEISWCLYDETQRVSRQANFTFSGNIYYGKQCIVYILGRQISLLLLYMQVLDIISHV